MRTIGAKSARKTFIVGITLQQGFQCRLTLLEQGLLNGIGPESSADRAPNLPASDFIQPFDESMDSLLRIGISSWAKADDGVMGPRACSPLLVGQHFGQIGMAVENALPRT